MRVAGMLLALAAALVPALALCAPPGGNAAGSSPPTPPPSAPPPGTQTSPFVTPGPSSTPGPIGNGYVILGYNGAAASGGVIPVINSTATPAPFPASNGTGFYAELSGRLSSTFAATLRFHDYSVHGGDNPIVNLSEGEVLYMPRGGLLALSLGYGSLQRSTSNASANSMGIGAALMPDLRRPVAPYASFFYYPSAQTLGSTAGISSAQAGIMFRPTKSGLLLQLGYGYIGYPNQNSSPTSLSGLQAGLGVTF